MFREPTLDQALRSMKNSVQYKDETTSKEEALRLVAEESAIEDVCAILEESENVPGNLRQKGIEVLIKKFESEYPDFELKTGEEKTQNRMNEWQERISNRAPGYWKTEYENGVGPGVFAVECSAKSRDGICEFLEGLFPEVTSHVLNYQVSTTPYGRTRVIFRLDGRCNVDELPDHLRINQLRELADSEKSGNFEDTDTIDD